MTFIQAKITSIEETKTDGVLTGVKFTVEITDDRFLGKRVITDSFGSNDIEHVREGLRTIKEIIKTHISWMRTDIDNEFAVIPVITETVSDTPEKIKSLIENDTITD